MNQVKHQFKTLQLILRNLRVSSEMDNFNWKQVGQSLGLT